ncbi:MAG: Fic family protein [Spirochaetales bacterium]|nr:Fic family protein [Spirochaetales bacterium]
MYCSPDTIDKYRFDAEGFADFFRENYYKNFDVSYPIDPFAIINDLGIHYAFRNLDRIEGLLLTDTDGTGVNLIVINSKRPIQRIRYSCAHELCHFLKDVGDYRYNPLKCFASSSNSIERYAESFAAALLMPRDEVKRVIAQQIKKCYLSFDDILIISDYFGVSFQSCYYRINSVSPEVLPEGCDSKIKKYHPNIRREEIGLRSEVILFEQVLNSWSDAWSSSDQTRATLVFKNEYIYNDSRMEGIDVSEDALCEIITDLRLNTQNSKYNIQEYYNLSEIAGHSLLYDYVFSYSYNQKISIYLILELNRVLFSCVPFPNFGGRTRTQNVLVLGSKFETVDYHDVMTELIKLDKSVQDLEENYSSMKKSEIVKEIVKIHHRLTVIHPFSDGNGRTSRAFMNLLLMRYGIPPVFITLERKLEYVKALSIADTNGNIDTLYSIIMKEIINSHSNYYSVRKRRFKNIANEK